MNRIATSKQASVSYLARGNIADEMAGRGFSDISWREHILVNKNNARVNVGIANWWSGSFMQA